MNLKKMFLSFCLMIFSLCLFCQESVESAEFLEPTTSIQTKSNQKSYVSINCNVNNAQIFINGIYQGLSPLKIYDLVPGFYFVQIRKNGFKTKNLQIFVRQNVNTEYFVELEQAFGFIKINNLLPNAIVKINGNEFSKDLIRLPVGAYQVFVCAFGYDDFSKTVLVTENAQTQINPVYNQAKFEIKDFRVSRKIINPLTKTSISKTDVSFFVTAPGFAEILVKNDENQLVNQKTFESFSTWNQNWTWTGTDFSGKILPNGEYKVILQAADFYKEIAVKIDENLSIPKFSYTPAGIGIGSLPIAFAFEENYVKSFLSTGAIFNLKDKNNLIYAIPVNVGAVFNFLNYMELGFSAGFYAATTEEKIPFMLNTSLKFHNSYKISENSNFSYGALVRYGLNTKNESGLGTGLLFSYEYKKLLAGISSQFVFFANDDWNSKEANILKNGFALSYEINDFVNLNAWINWHTSFLPKSQNHPVKNAFDAGIETNVILGNSPCILNAKVSPFFAKDEIYLNSSITLSYLF